MMTVYERERDVGLYQKDRDATQTGGVGQQKSAAVFLFCHWMIFTLELELLD